MEAWGISEESLLGTRRQRSYCGNAVARANVNLAVAPLRVTGHTMWVRRDHCVLPATRRGKGSVCSPDVWQATSGQHVKPVLPIQTEPAQGQPHQQRQTSHGRRREAKGAVVMETTTVGQCQALRLQCFLHQEEKARLVLANEELDKRLVLALLANQTAGSPKVPACPIGTAASGASAARTCRAKTAGGGRRQRARQQSLPTTTSNPSSYDPKASPLPLFASMLGTPAVCVRPSAGHVRDSELLRALQAAENRVAVLESILARQVVHNRDDSLRDFSALGGREGRAGEAFSPLLPNIVVISDEQEEDGGDVPLGEGVSVV